MSTSVVGVNNVGFDPTNLNLNSITFNQVSNLSNCSVTKNEKVITLSINFILEKISSSPSHFGGTIKLSV